MRMFTFALVLATTLSFSVKSDELDVLTTQISLSSVSLAQGALGDSSRLRFILENESSSALTFIGVDSPVAEDSTIRVRIDATDYATLESYSLKSGAILNFDTTHLWVELDALSQPLVSGDLIPISLKFVTGTLETRAHVH